jgi:maltose alpha-D-glucosyltransferase/alpha-amylase
VHGDYHLGQVLYTGKDFIIIDFEGEPARPLSTRRLKASPLVDVAGMVRSFHYAAFETLLHHPTLRPEELAILGKGGELWSHYVSGSFLQGYLTHIRSNSAPFVPSDPEELSLLLETFLLNKTIYELRYELNHRPDWLYVPMHGLKQLISQGIFNSA